MRLENLHERVSGQVFHEEQIYRGSLRTWRIVSKLKVKPFQRVNSPLVEPVKIRLASGVNYCSEAAKRVNERDVHRKKERERELTVTMLTGQRILFVEVCAYRLQKEVEKFE